MTCQVLIRPQTTPADKRHGESNHDRPISELVTDFFFVRFDLPLNARNNGRVQFNIKNLIKILPLVLSLTLMVGCASNFQSAGSGSSAVDDSSDRSFHDMIDQVNQQTAVDAANAAAQQQFNDAMAATQQTENRHNDEFNENGLH